MTRVPTVALSWRNIGANTTVDIEGGNGTKKVKVELGAAGATVNGVTVNIDKTLTFNFDNMEVKDFSGRVIVTIKETGAPIVQFVLRVPSPVRASDRVILTDTRNHLHATFAPVATVTTAVNVFGSAKGTSFLELKGITPNPVTAIKFVGQTGAEGMSLLSAANTGTDGTTGWRAQLTNLPAQGDGIVAAFAEFGTGEHVYAANRVAFTQQGIRAKPDVPTVQVVKTTSSSTSNALPLVKNAAGMDTARYASNATTVDVLMTPGQNTAGFLVRVDTKVTFVASTNASTTERLAVTTADNVTTPIVVTAVRGDVESDSVVKNVQVRTPDQGPRVVNVSAPGFGTSTTAKVQVQFAPTDVTLARGFLQATDAFTIVHNENKARTATTTATDPALTIAITDFDPVGNVVTLTVGGVLPGTYTLAVGPSKILDQFGNAAPAYQTILGAQQAADPPSVDRGITFYPGPAVPLAEYLNPRPLVEGFLPSDRVEARVVRLYYYRDAHRVAMLVNRTVKSYNSAGVAIQQRAADRTRDDADLAAEERKRLEAAAVRAAQEARAVETELNNLQNSNNSARNQAATARIGQSQLEQQLAQARRDLERTRLVTSTTREADQAVITQSQQVNNLQIESNELGRQIKVVNDELDKITGTATADITRKSELSTRLGVLQVQKGGTDRSLTDARLVLARLQAETKARVEPSADPAQQRVLALENELRKLQSVAGSADAVEANNAARIAQLQQTLATKREAEARTLEAWQVKELVESRLRRNQFRAEVAAAKADPGTYAPADPGSVDPVLQCNISVIGEGLIQIRGPIKGLNAIRTMINQIDAPVGQVRVSVHTLQVNGERGDHMEKVIANIQRYLDHSRFLTAQSAQILRNTVTAVAARKAAEAAATLAPGCTQWDRDQRYLYAFFGKDFTDELAQIDSEFLKTGNKLLSLNSMDSTSLSAALFLLALAKNDVRTEILNEFLAVVQRDLPAAEANYYLAGLSQIKHCDACKDKKEYLLANNARFQSLVGFFNAQITGTDTLSPLQREFVRLAQIFKARMITEMQLRQRVMERALLEDRVGTGSKLIDMLREAFELEKQAKNAVRAAQDAASQTQAEVAAEFQQFFDALTIIETDLDALAIPKVYEAFNVLANKYDANPAALKQPASFSPDDLFRTTTPLTYRICKITAPEKPDDFQFTLYKEWHAALQPGVQAIRKQLTTFIFFPPLAVEATAALRFLERIEEESSTNTIVFKLSELMTFMRQTESLVRGASQESAKAREAGNFIISQLLAGDDEAVRRALDAYAKLKAQAFRVVRPGSGADSTAKRVFGNIDAKVTRLVQANANVLAAARKAQQARRPLDEKRLLDILVDEMEDKFVEILEGTRSHTANMDNYMKSVATALDDDFNTQYYLPSFRRAREASRYWDVTLAQIETTSVLANNRSLGKVSPAASFEFDLPKRNILIKEGFDSAKALMNEYGALVNDPSFLALAKLSSGNPTSMMTGGAGAGQSAVRNVLPGLPSSADEMLLTQAGPGRQQFGSALEALIPDPAIYKFETGTGYEVRPVLSPDGQAVVFDFDYMYTTDVREPVRADEKHLGRVRRHFVHTDVQLSNYELREVSKYMVAIKAARTAKGVQLLQDIPGVGALFRPLPSAGSSLQQNLIYSQATIFPTLFDLMGLRYAPAVADIDPLADRLAEFAVRYRRIDIEQRMYGGTASRVDDIFQTPYGERRTDLHYPQIPIPYRHPNGVTGPGVRQPTGTLVEGFEPSTAYPPTQFAPGASREGTPKPYNPGFGPPSNGSPSFEVPSGYGPPLGGPHYPPLHNPPAVGLYQHPSASPYSSTDVLKTPAQSSLGGNAVRLPGMGSVGVGRPVRYDPALSTTPPPLRPAELPTTGGQTTVTTNPPPVPRPSIPTPSMPQPAGLVPSSPLGNR
ncbi:hypothetical protein R5W24_002541 [Gemmata sp. JC717]|uniref:hypothetical protein n=1 Tax=Gemmata algarum TaxID=2975278 RepID=UPI0021BACFC7|nr:hypothetical protein [Gemmata algarum]MDY3553439.1 hypothetical protein [Gemmata algarum]